MICPKFICSNWDTGLLSFKNYFCALMSSTASSSSMPKIQTFLCAHTAQGCRISTPGGSLRVYQRIFCSSSTAQKTRLKGFENKRSQSDDHLDDVAIKTWFAKTLWKDSCFLPAHTELCGWGNVSLWTHVV